MIYYANQNLMWNVVLNSDRVQNSTTYTSIDNNSSTETPFYEDGYSISLILSVILILFVINIPWADTNKRKVRK